MRKEDDSLRGLHGKLVTVVGWGPKAPDGVTPQRGNLRIYTVRDSKQMVHKVRITDSTRVHEVVARAGIPCEMVLVLHPDKDPEFLPVKPGTAQGSPSQPSPRSFLNSVRR